MQRWTAGKCLVCTRDWKPEELGWEWGEGKVLRDEVRQAAGLGPGRAGGPGKDWDFILSVMSSHLGFLGRGVT